MSRTVLSLSLVLMLSACASGQFLGGVFNRGADAPGPEAAPDAVETVAAPATPETAPRTAPENLDRAVAEAEALAEAERVAEAAAPAPAPAPEEDPLGETVASLGDPTLAGLWLETPLVNAPQDGRIVDEEGNAVNVRLIPTGGAPGSGSRISLAAMRVLGVDLTALVPVQVFTRG